MTVIAYLYFDKKRCAKEINLGLVDIPKEVCLPTRNLSDKKVPFELVFKERQDKGRIIDKNLDLSVVAYDFKGVRPK